jgi:nitrogen fixation NifU-like protein
MSELSELYQEVILDHNRRPRNFGTLEHYTHRAEGANPLCGDQMTLYLRVEGGVIADVAFEGVGCAISTASASLMTESIRGVAVDRAHDMFRAMIAMLTGDPTEAAEVPAEIEKLAVFAGVREFPARVKCATMAWHTLEAALTGEPSAATD